MTHAEICPVCRGRGYIEVDTETTSGIEKKVCHGCGGKGWIEVSDWTYYPATWRSDTYTIYEYTSTG